MNKLSRGHYYLIGLTITVVILLFASIRGCRTNSRLVTDNTILTQQRDNNHDSLELLKKEIAESAKDYQDSLSFERGQSALKNAQKEATEKELDKATNRIQWLLHNRIDIIPSDSGTTLVPNEFLSECKDCWIELDGQNRLVIKYRKDIKERDSINYKTTNIYIGRIAELEKQVEYGLKVASKLDTIATTALIKYKPRRIVYLSLSALWINNPIPNGAAVGFKYKDKKERIFGVKAGVTSLGKLYEGEASIPLSFKRK